MLMEAETNTNTMAIARMACGFNFPLPPDWIGIFSMFVRCKAILDLVVQRVNISLPMNYTFARI